MFTVTQYSILKWVVPILRLLPRRIRKAKNFHRREFFKKPSVKKQQVALILFMRVEHADGRLV